MSASTNNLEGKRALVTGATGGIGAAIVGQLVNAGVKLIAHGRSKKRLEELAAKYPGIIHEFADFNNAEQVEKLADKALKAWRGLDILINNAGMGTRKDVVDSDKSVFDATMNVNLRAVFILSKIIGRAMIEQGDGHIINIGSGASTTPIAGLAVYCASKYGLLGFSESLALETRKYGVKVSILMPGTTATGFGGDSPGERLRNKPGILLPENVAEAVIYLLNQPKRAWTSQMNLRPLDPNRVFES